MSRNQKFVAALTRQQLKAHSKDHLEWYNNYSYKVFLLERETGWRITEDFPGLVLVEKLNMLDRYWADRADSHNKTIKKTEGKSNTGKQMMK